MQPNELDTLCRQALVSSLLPGLKAAIDDALRLGTPRETIMDIMHRNVDGETGALTTAAVEAYLDSKMPPAP